jgi:alkylation response protein AidB-like acyl-CoA dehydrogenase
VRRPWWGPTPDEDRQAVLDLVDDLVATHLGRVGDDRPEAVDAARQALAEHGLWTLGADEAAGGGGADLGTTLLALARLAGTWPALAWASVQAHAAALLLGEAHDDLLGALHEGEPVAVVVDEAGDGGEGGDEVVRVDAASTRPRLVLLREDDTAVVLPADAVEHGPVLRRTGLDGASTHLCAVDREDAEQVATGEAVVRARSLLLLGAAALAAGVAEAAAQAALAYSRQRVQFGAPLTELPTVQVSLSEQASSVRSLLVRTVAVEPAALDEPDVVGAALGPALDAAFDVVAAAVQSHGGYGYMAEYAVEGLLRDLVSLRAAAGATEAGRRAARALAGAGS